MQSTRTRNRPPGRYRPAAGPLLPAAARQRGVALIVGLIILVVLALLGASAYSVATQDERIAGNARDHSRAMDAAETMLRDCEHLIETASPPFDGSVAGMYPAPANGATWLANSAAAWGGATYLLPAAKMATSEWSQAPQCIAESVPFGSQVGPAGLPAQAGTLRVAHVTARGYGLNKNTVVTLVTYVAFY